MDINKIDLKDGLSLIEASAGTGKSFTLSHVVIRNIFEKNINPENILLLSFTNNTCDELRSKIKERINMLEKYIISNKKIIVDITLKDWCDELQKKNYKENNLLNKIKIIKDDINRISITTFHGLCKKIIDDYSIELSAKLGSKVNNDINELYINIVNELWIEEYSQLDREIIKSIENKKISTKYNTKEVSNINKKLFINLIQEIDKENICEFNLKGEIKSNINEYLQKYILLAWNQFCEEWNSHGKNLFKELVRLGRLIEEKGLKSRVFTGNPRDKYAKINDWILKINKELNINGINNIIYEISQDDLLSKYFYFKTIHKEANKYNIEIDLSEFYELQEKIYQLKDGFFNIFIRAFLNKANLKLVQLKEKQNILNYNDLIKTIEFKYLNKNNKEERSIKYIRNKFKCILIDEFQDTDKVQWKIIRKLFNNKKHFMLCVGDPKQAIYKFRGGDIKTYLDAKTDSSKIYTMVDNYRTSKELIRIINLIYDKGLLSSKLNHPKLKAKNNTYLDFGSVFQIIEFSDKDDILNDYILNYIKYLLINFKDIDMNKIAILTLYNYQCIEIRDILNNHNFPCHIINKNNIFDTESAKLIELFINCLINPFSLKDLILLLTSKFIQINVEIFDDIESNEEIDKLSRKCKEWANNLNDKGFLNSVHELIDEYKSTFIIGNNDLMSNLFQLSEIIEKKLIINNYNLNNLYNWYQNELNKETRKLSGDEYLIKIYDKTEGINISTIHSSKGLEYDIVICPYLWGIRKSSRHLKGPLWKDNKKREIYINILDIHSKVQKLKSEEDGDLENESERLIYVALTRAKYKLIIFNNIDNLDNILNKNLLFNLADKEKYLFKTKINLCPTQIDQLKIKYNFDFKNKSPWSFCKRTKINLKKNSMEEIITRSSYSAWTSRNNKSQYELRDYEDQSSVIENKLLNTTSKSSDLLNTEHPLSSFPRGKHAGICLHKIIERYNFQHEDFKDLRRIILEELRNHAIDLSLLNNVEESILRLTRTSLGKNLQGKRLIDIPHSQIIKEFKYDLALSKNGLVIKSEDIAKCFCIEKEYDFGETYSKDIKNLKICSTGFHSGFIDCIIPIGNNLENTKWWIIDWKSNYLSSGHDSKCVPNNYNYENMRLEMVKHHYPLQSHLYLLALHRFLKWRLKNYNPTKNLGGYIYIFLRGLPEIPKENKLNNNQLSPGIFISNTPFQRINYLDNLFKKGSEL